MNPQVVLVHGIRTSATMWRAQVEWLAQHDIPVTAVDLPGHGTRMAEPFTLEDAMRTIDTAVRDAARHGPVILVGHSMGGLLSLHYTGSEVKPPVAALIAASCTALPRGAALATYRTLAGALDRLPDRGLWLAEQVLSATIPPETRDDFAAGGYALDAQAIALRSLSSLDLAAAVARIRIPLWFVNGQFDQLRSHETLFRRLAPDAELIVVPRTSHLVTAMRPRVFNAVLQLALAVVRQRS
ncbi:N-formylglutamate deformylase [Microbacterium esteraromaticum]|uniref:N-formylglutamate deformylase n=1 Tax=Microbacterium esteraromaticum TaxID=57043 RepID=A0A1R4KIJ2_9MICO|nr:alpha/beta hydrolase [Microbacterium esteraromaticum]SJN44150.1 N-formylglutamate deformylase [Microbacterium esteraromaticum]